MASLDIESLEVCPWALREGIVLRHLESMSYPLPFSLEPVQRTTTGSVASVTALAPTALSPTFAGSGEGAGL
jgi:exopolyphosphatase/guanosine-5'-triphosphate,3'-diphosphate pyrophosphatase